MKQPEINSANSSLWTTVESKSSNKHGNSLPRNLISEFVTSHRAFLMLQPNYAPTGGWLAGWLTGARGKELGGEQETAVGWSRAERRSHSPELSETPSSCSAPLARRLRVLPRRPPSASPGRDDAATTTVTAGGRHVSGGSAARARRGPGSRGRNRVAVEAATAEAIAGDELGRGRDGWSSGAYGRGWRRSSATPAGKSRRPTLP